MYTRGEMALRLGLFYTAASLSGAFGGLLARGLTEIGKVGGQAQWTWIFIIEGLLVPPLIPSSITATNVHRLLWSDSSPTSSSPTASPQPPSSKKKNASTPPNAYTWTCHPASQTTAASTTMKASNGAKSPGASCPSQLGSLQLPTSPSSRVSIHSVSSYPPSSSSLGIPPMKPSSGL